MLSRLLACSWHDLTMRFFIQTGIVVALFLVSSMVAMARERVTPDWNYAKTRMKKAGLKSSFVSVLKKSYEPDDFRDVTELNLLLFLRKVDQHAVQVTDEATEKVRDFMKENREALDLAERKYQVAGPVIASLLWMESRYGQNLGRFHVASVFVNLLQVDRPEVIDDLKKHGSLRFSDHPSKKDLKKVAARAKKKAKWAMEELRAVERIYRERGEDVLEFRGSFAGAFGMPQFLPSSYSRWAKSAQTKTSSPKLNKPDDAIHSVANYLKLNGWREKRKKTHVVALMNYNNSRDYANAILKLAKKVTAVHGLASTPKVEAASIKEDSDN